MNSIATGMIIAAIFICSALFYCIVPSSDKAEVSSKEFVCTATSSIGIKPRCDQYTRVKGPNLTRVDG